MLILCWEVQSQGSKREERGVWHGEGGTNTRGCLANQSPLGIKRNWPQVSQELLQRDCQVEEGRRISPWAFVFYWSEVQALTPPHFRVTHPWMTHFSGNREASLWKAELCGISLRWATLGHAHVMLITEVAVEQSPCRNGMEWVAGLSDRWVQKNLRGHISLRVPDREF